MVWYWDFMKILVCNAQTKPYDWTLCPNRKFYTFGFVEEFKPSIRCYVLSLLRNNTSRRHHNDRKGESVIFGWVCTWETWRVITTVFESVMVSPSETRMLCFFVFSSLDVSAFLSGSYTKYSLCFVVDVAPRRSASPMSRWDVLRDSEESGSNAYTSWPAA